MEQKYFKNVDNKLFTVDVDKYCTDSFIESYKAKHSLTEITKIEFDDIHSILNENELILQYKGYYQEVVTSKLKELDYDSIATVQLWSNDSTFGTEAIAILAWYKNIIAFNYAMINDIKAGGAIPTKEEYLLALPKYGA